jgi:hypothetical protein
MKKTILGTLTVVAILSPQATATVDLNREGLLLQITRIPSWLSNRVIAALCSEAHNVDMWVRAICGPVAKRCPGYDTPKQCDLMLRGKLDLNGKATLRTAAEVKTGMGLAAIYNRLSELGYGPSLPVNSTGAEPQDGLQNTQNRTCTADAISHICRTTEPNPGDQRDGLTQLMERLSEQKTEHGAAASATGPTTE